MKSRKQSIFLACLMALTSTTISCQDTADPQNNDPCDTKTFKASCTQKGEHMITCKAEKIQILQCATNSICKPINDTVACIENQKPCDEKMIPYCQNNTVVSCASQKLQYTPCVENTFCDNGTCKPKTIICRHGEKKCEQNTLKYCENNTWKSHDCTLSNATCDPQKLECINNPQPPKCQENQKICEQNTLKTCKNGTWIDKDCSLEQKSCDPLTLDCTTKAITKCNDNQKLCLQNTLKSCKNGAWVDKDCEEDNNFCNPSTLTCEPKTSAPQNLIFSEFVVSSQDTSSPPEKISAIAIEITNIADNENIKNCKISAYKTVPLKNPEQPGDRDLIPDTEKPLNFELSTLKKGQTLVLCNEDAKKLHKDKCQQKYTWNTKEMDALQLSCNGKVTDTAFMSVVNGSLNFDDTNFRRHCNIKQGLKSLLDENKNFIGSLQNNHWNASAKTLYSPSHDLGQHCTAYKKEISYCKLNAENTDFTQNPTPILNATMQLKIPSITDKTNKTDLASTVLMSLTLSQLKNGKLTPIDEYSLSPSPDINWQSSEAIDQYTFSSQKATINAAPGKYYLHYAISLDNGNSWTFCSKSGISNDTDETKNIILTF